KQHFKEVLEFLDTNEIPYSLNTRLVRGLDYYSRTVFEFIEETENESGQANFALGGGGRYDYLSQMLSNKKIPAVGGALGIDRIAQLILERQIKIKSSKETKIFFIQLGSMAKYKSLKIIEMFRKSHIPLMQSISKDTLKSQLRIASKLNMSYALILGQREAMEESIIVKNMETSAQETVPIEKVVEFAKNKLKQND
ncbi:ATP phosphoribosyltransferase regulatory subunit, partial [Patescibacteria group bacterium]|nr:ATP phosphoribosyltransferase regulatory subunit [Patescibacteria group bacterium]